MAAINPTLGVLANALTTFTGQLTATLQAGIAAGLTGFQALLNALGNPASALFAAFQAALEAFPNPQAFINALVQAFGNIDVNLGLALQAVLNVAIDGPQAFLNALISGGAALAAAFNAALANFPSPQLFVDAFVGALAAINPTLGILANAFTTFTGQLNATLQAGIAAGLTGFQALLNALGNPASALFAAFQAALEAFPNPQAFINALVQAFGNIDVNLGLALQAVLNVAIDGPQAFLNALISGGAALAAAFNAALANFPSPAAFVAALTGALAAINPTLGVLANALTTFTGQLNATLQAGIAAGLTGFQALLNALGNPASALFAAFQAALEAFPNPQAFINALVQAFGNIDVNLGLALQAVLNVAIDGPQAFLNALISGGAALAAAFNAALANFPSPAAFVAALTGALAAINPTLGVLANAFTTFTGQLDATLQAGIAAGLTGFQALLNALGNPASALFAAFQAALEAFPNPQAFINALVQAFGNIDVNLGLALQAVINVAIDGPQAFSSVDLRWAALAAAFNAALANFPSPAAFVAALNNALAAINPTLGVLANAFTTFTGQLATRPSRRELRPGSPVSRRCSTRSATRPAHCSRRSRRPWRLSRTHRRSSTHWFRPSATSTSTSGWPYRQSSTRPSMGHRPSQRADLRRGGPGGSLQRRTGQLPEPAGVRGGLANALAAINPTLGILANAFTTFTGQLADTIQAGIAAGSTASRH